MSPSERGRGGFTLFEVLAAFLIFALVFSVLATTASEAFRAEGENQRRLEASLIADEALASIEDAASTGVALPLGESPPEEQDIFTLTIEVTALSLDALGLGGLTGTPGGGDDPASAILQPTDPQQDPPLRRVVLRVSWDEGDRTLAVQRSTFAMDMQSLQAAFPEGALGGGGDTDGGDEDPLIIMQRLLEDAERLGGEE